MKNGKTSGQHGPKHKGGAYHQLLPCLLYTSYIQNGRVLQSADKDTFLRSFEHLKTPQDAGPLTLEEIMLRTERSEWDDDDAV